MIDDELLQRFVGGTCYCRLVDFSVGPDWYILFRFKIKGFLVYSDGGFGIFWEDIKPNRFISGSWVENQTGQRDIFEACKTVIKGVEISLPFATVISSRILHIKTSETTEMVFYLDENDIPDDIECFKHFNTGHEKIGIALLNQIKTRHLS